MRLCISEDGFEFLDEERDIELSLSFSGFSTGLLLVAALVVVYKINQHMNNAKIKADAKLSTEKLSPVAYKQQLLLTKGRVTRQEKPKPTTPSIVEQEAEAKMPEKTLRRRLKI